MDAKLTLSLDQKVIERAKKYAKLERISLSELVENYFKLLTADIRKDEEDMVNEPVPGYSLIEKYKGAFKLDDNRDYKDILKEELWKKHMK